MENFSSLVWNVLLFIIDLFVVEIFYLKYIQKCLEISSVPGIRTIGCYIQFQSNNLPTNGSPQSWYPGGGEGRSKEREESAMRVIQQRSALSPILFTCTGKLKSLVLNCWLYPFTKM